MWIKDEEYNIKRRYFFLLSRFRSVGSRSYTNLRTDRCNATPHICLRTITAVELPMTFPEPGVGFINGLSNHKYSSANREAANGKNRKLWHALSIFFFCDFALIAPHEATWPNTFHFDRLACACRQISVISNTHSSIVGFHMTSLKFKLKNYRSYRDFAFTMN